MEHLPGHQKGLLAVLAAAVLWSTGGILVKLTTLTAMQISFFRCIWAALFFAVIFKKNVFRVNGITFINAVFYAFTLILFVLSTKMTTAANAIFLQYTAPIYVLILEPLINKIKYEKINIITITICFFGMILFFLGEISPGYFWGNILALLSGVTFAGFLLGMKKNENKYQFSSIFYGNVIVSIFCFPFLFEVQNLSFSNLWMVTFLGIFQIGLAYAIFSYGLKRVYAIEASLIAMIEPVLNPVWVFLWYGEIPSITAVIGGTIIISVIAVRAFIRQTPFMKGRIKA